MEREWAIGTHRDRRQSGQVGRFFDPELAMARASPTTHVCRNAGRDETVHTKMQNICNGLKPRAPSALNARRVRTRGVHSRSSYWIIKAQ